MLTCGRAQGLSDRMSQRSAVPNIIGHDTGVGNRVYYGGIVLDRKRPHDRGDKLEHPELLFIDTA